MLIKKTNKKNLKYLSVFGKRKYEHYENTIIFISSQISSWSLYDYLNERDFQEDNFRDHSKFPRSYKISEII